MTITSTSRHTNKKGEVRGTIRVRDGHRRHVVNYACNKQGCIDQWGASTDVLMFTWPTAERLSLQEES